jgi:hypothetical protein
MLRKTGHTSCDVKEDRAHFRDVKEDWGTFLVMLRRTETHFS